MKIKIEKGIPIAKTSRSGSKVAVMRQMNIGDSFLSKSPNHATQAALAGIKLSVRKQPDGQFRVWRIK